MVTGHRDVKLDHIGQGAARKPMSLRAKVRTTSFVTVFAHGHDISVAMVARRLTCSRRTGASPRPAECRASARSS